MDKIKFIVVLIAIVILFQIPFLTEHDDIYSVLNMLFTVSVYLIGIKKIKKDTPQKNYILYGFLLLWFVSIYLITHFIGGYRFKSISIIGVGWEYSVIIVYVISKILSLEVVQEKFDFDLKYLVKTMFTLFLIGSLIACGIEYVESDVMKSSSLDKFSEILYFVNVSIFIVLLFHTLQINVNEKDFVMVSAGIGIIIILLLNIFPIQEINSIISEQKNVYEIINSNTLTYENISIELGLYLPDNEIAMETETTTKTWDYQQYELVNENFLSIIDSWIQNVTKSNFSQILENIQSVSKTLNSLVKAGKLSRNYRIMSIFLSCDIIIYMGTYLILKENQRYNV